MHLCEVCGEPIEGNMAIFMRRYFHGGCWYTCERWFSISPNSDVIECEACGESIAAEQWVGLGRLDFHKGCWKICREWIDDMVQDNVALDAEYRASLT